MHAIQPMWGQARAKGVLLGICQSMVRLIVRDTFVAQVLEYPGRYTHWVAISNERILGMKGNRMCFRQPFVRNAWEALVLAT